jgi:hypothetical protein
MTITKNFKSTWQWSVALFVVLLAGGAFLRFWQLGSIPPGLNQDEASIGLDAYYIFHFGVDRNAISYPVNFVSWGSGVDSLYSYFIVPFMGLGLTPLVERLPMAISGVITLALVYLIGRRCMGDRFGLLAMFMVAISPWHIMLSRWGLNDNILVFTFALAVAMMLQSNRANGWFITSMVAFAACLYAYGAAYVAVPAFVLLATWHLYRAQRVSIQQILMGWLLLGVLAIPIVLFVAVNTFGWDSIHLGLVTIPRLPIEARFANVSIFYSANPLAGMQHNLGWMWNVLWNPSDEALWNILPPYGYGFPGAILIAMAGLAAYLLVLRKRSAGPIWILPIWLVAASLIGIAQETNVNRLNLLLLAILFMMAAALEFIFERWRVAGMVGIGCYIGLAVLFANIYLGSRYAQLADEPFYSGFVEAMRRTVEYPAAPVCVTNEINQPFVYTLWADPGDPREFLSRVEYFPTQSNFRFVKKFGRYTYGLENCSITPETIVVTWTEKPPVSDPPYQVESYGLFHVYIPTGLPPHI